MNVDWNKVETFYDLINKGEGESVFSEIAYELTWDLEEVIEAHKKEDIRIFESIDKCFEYIYLEHNDKNDIARFVMEELVSITEDNLVGYRSLADYILCQDDNVAYISRGRVVYIYE